MTGRCQRHSSSNKPHVEPEGEAEQGLANALAELLGIERVSAEDHFFDDLGANSLLMARYSAKLRKELDIHDVSMRDIYANPTVRSMAAILSTKSGSDQPKGNQSQFRAPTAFEYYGCGALQLLFYGANIALGLWLFVFSVNWVFAATDVWNAYGRTVGLSMALLAVSIALPFVAKWGLIGRWKEERFPIWSLRYFRFWIVKQYIRTNPMAAFVGTPIYNMYLRLLGAKIGKNVVILSKSGPICTDLIEIGDNTVLSRETLVRAYRAEGGYIETGSISIGKHVFVGEASVVDLNTVMEDHSQLGHSSALHANMTVPAGKRFHGSPAEETTTNYCTVEAKNCTSLRKLIYSAYLVITAYFIILPLLLLAISVFLPSLFGSEDALAKLSTLVDDYSQLITWYLPILSFSLFVLSIPMGLLFVILLTRLANAFIKDGKTYVLYGLHYVIFKFIHGVSNSKFYNVMFGDSSYIVYYLRWIGYDLSKIEQTGSNFGTVQQHDNPLLCQVGRGTMVSDALRFINAEFSTSSFRLSKVTLGEKNYLGNSINFPPNSRTGNNCLLATKVMIPIDGPVRENVGLLGSPCFEIPRSTLRDQRLADSDQRLRDRELRNKNNHNLWTIAFWLLALWVFSMIGLYLGFVSLALYNNFGIWSLIGGAIAGIALTIGYFVALEWLSLGFKRLEPGIFSIYDRRYWGVERHWKVADSPLIYLFAGTPFRPMIYRLLGVRMGRNVFDDGCMMSERTMIRIGDCCTLNEESTIQCHSLEEGVFKSGGVTLGRGCTLGVNAFAHYSVTMGDNVILEADSFLMKGETVEPNEVWMGNPAKAI